MDMRTKDLTGAALDWAVNVANGMTPKVGVNQYGAAVLLTGCSYSTNWDDGGALSESNGICALYEPDRDVWIAFKYRPRPWHERPEDSREHEQEGLTELVAKMRCIVASRLGPNVNVPDEFNPARRAAPGAPAARRSRM